MTGNRLAELVVSSLGNRVFAQSEEMGALPLLYAATMPDVPGAAYVGPDGPFEQRGHPRYVGASAAARDAGAARRLWAVSEELTGVRYEFGAPVASGSGGDR
jgi:hypothetical protein